jgi:hypothetical protein
MSVSIEPRESGSLARHAIRAERFVAFVPAVALLLGGLFWGFGRLDLGCLTWAFDISVPQQAA